MRNILTILALIGLAGCSSSPNEVLPPEMKDGIRNAIKNNQTKFARCHTEAVKKKTGFTEGTIHLQWEIDEKGLVKNAGVKPAGEKAPVDPKFEKCLVTAVEKIKFPAAAKDQFARVVFPFIFRK